MSDLRSTGDAWVTAGDGRKYWGRYGAAGLLAHDRKLSAILLQHRVDWSDHGGTWGIPGGALHPGEPAAVGAIREAQEEAGVPDGATHARFTHLLDRVGWTYTTVIADVTTAFEPRITDAESHALAWVPCDEVENYLLHPAFAASWPTLRPLLGVEPVVVVDAANVVGSVPDGWWKDRFAAADRLRQRIELLSEMGVRSGFVGLPESAVAGLDRAFPDWVLITEGTARGIAESTLVTVASAPEIGDDTIVEHVRELSAAGRRVTVVTSDEELIARVLSAGAITTRGSGVFTRMLPKLPEIPPSER